MKEAVWKDISSVLFITRAQFEEVIGSWMLRPILGADGDLRFVWMERGPEVHLVRVSDGPVGRLTWAKLGVPLLKRYGFIQAKVTKGNTRMRKFIERLGGFLSGEDEYEYHYRIERLNHV